MALIDELDPACLDAPFASIGDGASRITCNVMTNARVGAACLDCAEVVGTPAMMSHHLDQWKATSQKKSGRCWLFSSLNLLRGTTRERIGMKDFEFSRNHVLSFDKLERANYFLRDVVAYASEPMDSRLVQFLLSEVLGNGDQWGMAVSLYQKYRLISRKAMPETQPSSNTSRMDTRLQALLRRSALEVCGLLASGALPKEVEALISTVFGAVWRILVICLGGPSRSFDWERYNNVREFYRDGTVIPKEFFDRHVGADLSEYMCLVGDPRHAYAKGWTLTVKHPGNVVGRRQVRCINTEMAAIKKIVSRMIA